MNKYTKESLEFFKNLIEIPSVAGYCEKASEFIEDKVKEMGLKTYRNNKGTLFFKIDGKDNSRSKIVCAHIDTLGAMVSEIKQNGRLRVAQIGGYAFGSVEGENCVIHTRDKKLTGTLLPDNASVHIFGDETRYCRRDENSVEIRIDEYTKTYNDTIELGVRVGDFVTFETRTRILENGYIKSRYLDDKLCVSEIIYAVKRIIDEKIIPDMDTVFVISENEEIGHGISGLPTNSCEILAVDIGTVGGSRTSDEKKVTIAAKDSRTPYPYKFRRKLEEICEESNIDYVTDVLIRYGSDASVSVCQGMDLLFGCIGPGVDATHHYERTHIDAHENTMELVYHYIKGVL